MNILFLIVILLVAFKMYDGYKKGMVKEIVSFVSLLILAALVALIAGGISSYNSGKILNVIIAVVLLILLSIVHRVLSLVFFSAKLISKLPVIHSADKVLGILFGFLEVVIMLWTGYTLVMVLDLGAIEQLILSCTQENPVLSWFYRNNYLAYFIIENILSKPLPGIR